MFYTELTLTERNKLAESLELNNFDMLLEDSRTTLVGKARNAG